MLWVLQELDVSQVAGVIVPGGGGLVNNASNVVQFFRKEQEDLKVLKVIHNSFYSN